MPKKHRNQKKRKKRRHANLHKDAKRRRWIVKQLVSRFGGRCSICKEHVTLREGDDRQATIDHVIPMSRGGSDELDNLQLACAKCNNEKGNDMPEEATNGWEDPKEVSDVLVAFPAHTDDLLPNREDIPDEFWQMGNPYNQMASKWFFSGLSQDDLDFKPTINRRQAIRHLHCIMRSFEPEHHHKIAGVAWLISLWDSQQ